VHQGTAKYLNFLATDFLDYFSVYFGVSTFIKLSGYSKVNGLELKLKSNINGTNFQVLIILQIFK